MSRIFGLGLMLAALYVGLTIYTEGTDRALGGIFASAPVAPDTESSGRSAASRLGAGRPLTERIRERVKRDLQKGAARYDRQLDR